MPTRKNSLAPWWAESAMSGMFFCSGAAGLIFENVWLHRTGLVFGDSIWATSIVLAAYMGGIALGNGLLARRVARVESPLIAYAGLETAVALSGLGLTYLLPALPRLLVPITRGLLNAPAATNVVRAASAFVLLALPTSAMGATLPLLAGYVTRRRNDVGRALGCLYGWNTLGAVLGVAGSELVLVARFGIAHTAWIAAALDLVVAVSAIGLSRGHVIQADTVAAAAPARRPRTVRAHRPAPDATGMSPARLMWCSFIAGGSLMALEVIWFRFLLMFVLNNTLSIAIILAVVLTGIGAGGLTAATRLRQRADAVAHVPTLALMAGLATAATYAAFNRLTHGSLIAGPDRILSCALVLTLPTSLCSGVIFTLLGEALTSPGRASGQTAEWLLVSNTVGAMCGPLVAAFVMLPALGMERSFFALALAYLLIAALSLRDTRAARTPMARRVLAVTAVVTTAGLLAFPFGLMAHTYFPRVAEPYTSQGEQVVAVHEGTSETILFMQNSWMGHPSYHRLVTNGFPMTATLLPAKRYMRYFAYWPLLFHRAPLRSALVICYGMGVTAGAVTEIDSLESIDVVDVSRDMVSMSDRVYPPDQHPLHDRRSHLHFEDGRYFLQTTGQRFDLITGEPPPPRTPGTVNLYTREYFQLLHDRLNEGGTTTYWLPVARPPFEEVQVASIIRAFCDVFEDCSLWNGTPADWILVGTRHASGQVSAAQMEAPWTHARVNASLREIGFEVPEQLAATFLADAHDLRALTAHSLPLTDDYPRRLDSADAGRPALDPYGENPQALYRTLRDIDRARRAFEDSDFIRTLLPSTLLHDTAPYFAVQRVIDRVLADGPNILSQAGDLQWLLTRTTLRSPPFWILGQGNHPLTSERLASLHDDGSGSIEYVRGLALLVDRDYAGAVSLLSHSLQRGLVDGAPALVVALCLSGRCDLAQELRPHGPIHDADEAAFWGWVDAASLRGHQTGAGGDDPPEFR